MSKSIHFLTRSFVRLLRFALFHSMRENANTRNLASIYDNTKENDCGFWPTCCDYKTENEIVIGFECSRAIVVARQNASAMLACLLVKIMAFLCHQPQCAIVKACRTRKKERKRTRICIFKSSICLFSNEYTLN